MKLGALAGGTCRVCGSDTYGAEIGCGCIRMYHQAGFIVLRNHDKDSLEYNWGIEMKFIMNDFCSWYEEKMNRCEYVEIKNGERIRVLGRLEIIGTESVHGYGVIVDQIDFLGRNL